MKSMRELIKLMEGVTAVPGINQSSAASAPATGSGSDMQTASTAARSQNYAAFDAAMASQGNESVLDEKSTSEKQARFMAAAAHDSKFAKKVGMDTGVAKEFNKADTGTKQLSNAMKNKKTNESLTPDEDTLMQQYHNSIIDRQEFLDQMASIEYAEQSMRQGEMGMHSGDTQSGHDAWALDQDQDGINGDEYEYSDQEEFDEANSTDIDSMGDSMNSEMLQMARDRFNDLVNNFVEPEQALITVKHEFSQQEGVDQDFLDSLNDAITDFDPTGDHASIDDINDCDSLDNEQYPDEEFDEDFNLNNGYDDINDASGDDYFPNGADSPVVRAVGPSGARHGDNPEQKKMQVAEVHKELVYGYRNYLKEATALESKKKS